MGLLLLWGPGFLLWLVTVCWHETVIVSCCSVVRRLCTERRRWSLVWPGTKLTHQFFTYFVLNERPALSLCLHLNAHLSGVPGLAGTRMTPFWILLKQDDGGGGDNCSYKTCKAPAKFTALITYCNSICSHFFSVHVMLCTFWCISGSTALWHCVGSETGWTSLKRSIFGECQLEFCL